MQIVLGLLDAGYEVEGLRSGQSPAEHLQAGLAALQGVAVLVGQTGHHLADGRQPLRLQGSPLGFLQVRDVILDRDEMRDGPRRIPDRRDGLRGPVQPAVLLLVVEFAAPIRRRR